MRILTGIDVPFLPFGGSLLCCDDWYSNLPEDVEARFLTLPNPTGEKWWSMEDVVMLDVEKARTPEGFDEYVRRLKVLVQKQIDAYQPDVIHCQHLNYGLSRAFAEIDTAIPRIGICHGTDVQSATHNPFFLENLRYICRAMDAIVFPNTTMYEDFKATFPEEKKHYISPLGIPDRYFSAQRRQLSFKGTGTLRVLYVGRLLAWKGPDIAVEAMSLVRHDMHLTVIGNEDQKGFRQQLLDTVAANNLGERVTFLPQLPRDELLKSFDDYDVIVFPSRRLEAFSLTVVEAQARGLPLIFHPGGGITNTVGDGGLRLAECTSKSLAASLDYVYQHPDILARLQRKAYANAEQYRLSASQERLFHLSQAFIA